MTIQSVSFSSSCSYSSSSVPHWNYDVFLSFRGEDTRKGFTGHLYHALCQNGVKTFEDGKELRRGEEISHGLLEAIEQSKISVIVFSKNYATSTWCLDELVKILECQKSLGQMVLPIFYDVDPSEVRKLEGRFGEALAMHEEQFDDNVEKVWRWRGALKEVASFSGWHLSNRHEPEFIQTIVKEISNHSNRTFLNVAKHPVGLDSHIHAVLTLLSLGCDDVGMIGVHGIGGIGKTTIAKAVYNLIANQFEVSSFLANIREMPEQYGLVQLQERLLYEISGDSDLKLGNVDRGIMVIRDRLCNKKVLLVLDDVDNLKQLEKLAGDKNWFGPGSRVIITTRDQHILVAHGVETIYKVPKLSHDDALQLFSWNAFKKSSPAKDYEDFANSAVRYAKGLPLALVVLGSFLYGRRESEWESTICRLENSLNKEVYEILKISFDGLEDHEKAIFLDIACFFTGEDSDYVTKILQGCDFHPVIGIAVLIEKSLLSIEKKKLQMHSLLQLMGRHIVHHESPELGKRSRLWFHDDVLHVLTENTGTNAVEGIKLHLPGQENVLLNPEGFTKMKSLRLLIICDAHFSEGPVYLSNELRLLDWPRYPSPSMPSTFCPKKLVVLNMPDSKIERLEGFKVLENLKYINFSHCKYLTCIPGFSTCATLESLIVYGCENLVEVHESVGFLDKLVVLDASCCYKLRSLPSSLKLTRLERLYLRECIKLERFPDIVGEMGRLVELDLTMTAIKEVPSSVEYLVRLRTLMLAFCENLINLPTSIYKLQSLYLLNLEGCSNLRKFPKSFSENEEFSSCSGWLSSSNLSKDQDLGGSVNGCNPLRFRFPGPSNFLFSGPVLSKLLLQNCNLFEVDFLMSLGCFSTLYELDLSGNHLVTLPASISKFTYLKLLRLRNCERLQEIPDFPPENRSGRLQIDASGCKSLIETGCKKVVNVLSSERFCGEYIISIILPGRNLPDWFHHRNTEGSISFQVPSHLCTKFAGLICYSVLRLEDGAVHDFELEIQLLLNGETVLTQTDDIFESLNSDNVWLYYLPRRLLRNLDELLLKKECSHFEVSFRIIGRENLRRDLDPFKAFEYGVHLVCKQDEQVNDPSHVFQCCCPTLNEANDKSMDLVEDIQPTKRCLEDDNCDDPLKINCSQRQKRHCGALGITQNVQRTMT